MGPRGRSLYGGLLCTIDLGNDPVRTYRALADFRAAKDRLPAAVRDVDEPAARADPGFGQHSVRVLADRDLRLLVPETADSDLPVRGERARRSSSTRCSTSSCARCSISSR
jgi:hypothetical protein